MMKGLHIQITGLSRTSLMTSFAILFRSFQRQFSTLNSDKQLLLTLETLVNQLRTTNSINSKIEMIRQKPELRSLLKMIYAPEVRFHIKSSSIKQFNSSSEPSSSASSESIEELLSKLSTRTVSGNSARQALLNYLNEHSEYRDLIECIIDKNLKVRIGFGIIKKSFPEMTDEQSIPIALGYPIDKYIKSLQKSIELDEKWFISRKYDGIRTILVYNKKGESLTLLTRHLQPIFGLNPVILSVLRTELSKLEFDTIILDGELVYFDGDGRENFSKTINLVKSMAPKPIGGLEFRVFDLINSCDDSKFSERFQKLKSIFNNSSNTNEFIKVVDQILCGKEFDHNVYLKKATELNYEGFIIRRDCELKDGRSKDLLKIKPFHDDEFKVINYEIGPMRLINESSRIESTENVLLSVTIDFNGFPVNVGSGFSNAERIEFAEEPEKILHKIITVQYQSESLVEGRQCRSIRFPVFKKLHGNNRTE